MTGRGLVVRSVNAALVVATERLPATGETVLGGTFSRFHGGKGGNQAVAAARLGAVVMIVAALGGDALGTEARRALARDGVGTDVLVTLEGTATGVALILVDEGGENAIAVAPGANAGLTPAHVADALRRLGPGPGDAVLVTHEISTATAREGLRLGGAARAARRPPSPPPPRTVSTDRWCRSPTSSPRTVASSRGSPQPMRAARAAPS